MATIVVHDYDEAIAFYCNQLGFTLMEDSVLSPEKRWVRVAANSHTQSCFLLAKAKNDAEKATVGRQTGGRVSFFLYTYSFAETYDRLLANGVQFTELPRQESFGRVVVFKDLYGNLWDLIQPFVHDLPY